MQLYLNPEAEHLLDWFHVTMRLTVLRQITKGAPETIGAGEEQYELRPKVLKQLESIKWYLWHGNVFQALHRLEDLEMDLDAAAFDSKNQDTAEAPEGRRGITHLRRAQSDIHTELWGALSQRRKNRFRFRRVGGQSGNQQANEQASTNAVDTTWRALASAD